MKKETKEKYANTDGFQFDEESHSYFMDGKPMTGCTTILGVMAKPALIPWAARMAVEYVREHSSLRKIAHEQVEQAPSIETLYEVSEETLQLAQKAHTQFRDKRAAEGTDLHALAEEYIKSCIANGGDPRSAGGGDNEAIRKFADWAITENITFKESEVKLFSKKLFVAGTADFMFEKEGKLFVGDIKNKKKIYGRESFFQCAGYSKMRSEMTGEAFDGYCVVRLWENEIEPLWSFDTEGDQEGFMACVRLYRLLAENNTVK